MEASVSEVYFPAPDQTGKLSKGLPKESTHPDRFMPPSDEGYAGSNRVLRRDPFAGSERTPP